MSLAILHQLGCSGDLATFPSRGILCKNSKLSQRLAMVGDKLDHVPRHGDRLGEAIESHSKSLESSAFLTDFTWIVSLSEHTFFKKLSKE